MWDYSGAALQSGATDSESYPNLVSSAETQLGELVAVVFITLHRSPAMGVIRLHPVRREPSCNNIANFTTEAYVSHSPIKFPFKFVQKNQYIDMSKRQNVTDFTWEKKRWSAQPVICTLNTNYRILCKTPESGDHMLAGNTQTQTH